MKIFILICSVLLLITSVSADMDIFDNLNASGYNITANKFIGSGSLLTNLTESQIDDLQHTADTNRSDAEINTLIDNRVIQSFIELLGFVIGSHTVDTNRSDADILSVASIYNETDWVLNQSYLTFETDPIFTSENSSIWSAINNKLESTDQKYNDTNFIEAVNTTSNIEGLGFVTGSHTTDTNRTDTEINTLIDNRVVQAFIEALGFFTGAHTVDTNRSNEDILNVTSVYNDTVAINTKLDATDQRYNETGIINSVNTTSNIESLGFVQGAHTTDTNRSDSDILSIASVYNETNLINSVNTTSNIEGLGFIQGAHTTDTNRSDSEINTLIDNRVIQSFIETLGFVIGAHTIDTNRSDVDILSVANVYNDTSKIDAVNTTSNIEGLGFVQGQHTTDTNRSDSDILSVASVYNNTNFIFNQNYQNATQVNNSIIAKITQAFVEALGFVIGEHTVDTNRSDADILNVASVFNETDLINSVNTTSNIESLGFTQGQHTVDTNRSDADIISVASIYNETDWVIAQSYLTSESDPNLWTTLFNTTGDNRWLDDTTIGNCSGDGSCSAITYDSETSGWDKNEGDDLIDVFIDDSELPLANKTTPHCSNITGASYDVCNGDGGGGMNYTNVAMLNETNQAFVGVQNFSQVNINSALNLFDVVNLGSDSWSNTELYLENDFYVNSLANCDADNEKIEIDSGGQMICGVAVDTDTNRTDAEINTLIDNRVIQSFIEGLGFVTGAHTVDTNRSDADIISVASIYNETDLINSVNTTSNIESLGFTQGAHTVDTNESVRFGNLVDVDCGGTDKVIGVQANGTVLCGVDQTGAGGGNPFDQSLNTTEAVTFVNVTTTSSTSGVWEHFILANSGAFSGAEPSIVFKNTAGGLDTARIGSVPGAGYAASKLIFYVANSVGNLQNRMSIDVDGNLTIAQLTNCDTIDTDGNGMLSCGTDLDTTYTHLSNFTDNIGVSSDWDEIGDVPIATPSNGDTTHLSTADQIYDWVIGLGYITDGNTNWDNSYGFITNSVSDLANYYLKTEIDTQGEMETIWGVSLATDTELAGQDACSEISGCVVGAITDGNTNWDNSYGFITSTNVAYTNKSNTFSGEQFFNAGINITQDQNISIGACQETWNGTCLNTYCQGTLIQSIGCA